VSGRKKERFDILSLAVEEEQNCQDSAAVTFLDFEKDFLDFEKLWMELKSCGEKAKYEVNEKNVNLNRCWMQGCINQNTLILNLPK